MTTSTANEVGVATLRIGIAGRQYSPYDRGMAKVMVSLPDDLLAEIDRVARTRGSTRSGLLADAARRELARRDPEALRAIMDRMKIRAAKYGVPTAADVRADRDERDRRDRAR